MVFYFFFIINISLLWECFEEGCGSINNKKQIAFKKEKQNDAEVFLIEFFLSFFFCFIVFVCVLFKKRFYDGFFSLCVEI